MMIESHPGATGSEELSEDMIAPVEDEHDHRIESEPEQPRDVPQKFRDPETGELRVDALLKSYRELERRLGQSSHVPDDDDAEAWERLYRATGRPETPEAYDIATRHPLLSAEPEINRAMYAAGFSQKQAQLAYDLAAEHLLPALDDAISELSAKQERDRLVEHFGSAERWTAVSEQLSTWAKSRLSEEVVDALSSSADGVIAMHEMMRVQEPGLVGDGTSPSNEVTEAELNSMVGDERYWRRRDPQFIARVTEGYRRLYGD